MTLLDVNFAGDTIRPLSTMAVDADGLWIGARGRLWGVDAPEDGQPGYAEALSILESYNMRSTAGATRLTRIVFRGIDVYGRMLVSVYKLSTKKQLYTDAAAEIIECGWGWATEEEYKPVEERAREAKRGIWGMKRPPIPPWEWRKSHNRKG